MTERRFSWKVDSVMPPRNKQLKKLLYFLLATQSVMTLHPISLSYGLMKLQQHPNEYIRGASLCFVHTITKLLYRLAVHVSSTDTHMFGGMTFSVFHIP